MLHQATLKQSWKRTVLIVLALILVALTATQQAQATGTEDLTVVKSNDVGGATTVGTQWNWILTISNANLTVVFNNADTIMVDELDDNPALVYGTPSIQHANASSITCDMFGTALVCYVSGPSVSVTSSEDLVITIPVTAYAPGTYTNPGEDTDTCEVNPDEDGPEASYLNNDCGPDEVTVTGEPYDLVVRKEFEPDAILVGDNSTARFTLTNLSDENLFDIALTDVFPSDLLVVGGSTTCTNGDFSGLGSTFQIFDVDLLSGESCEIEVFVEGQAAGVYVNNQDNLTTFTGKRDADTNPEEDLIYPDFSAQLVVAPDLNPGDTAKAFGQSSAFIGESIDVLLSVGVDDADQVDIEDILPANLTIDTATYNPTLVLERFTNCNLASSYNDADPDAIQLLFELDEDDADDGVCVIQFEVQCDAAGVALNEAEFVFVEGPTSTSSDEVECLDPSPPPSGGGSRDQTDGGPTVVVSDPAISKNGSPENAVVGESVTWTINVTNPGTEPINNVVVQDAVPPQFDIITATATQGTVDITGQDVTANLGTLLGGGTATITISTIANDTALPGTVCNSAYWGTTPATDCVTFFPDALPPTGGPSPLVVTLRTLIPVLALLGLAGVGSFLVLRRRTQ